MAQIFKTTPYRNNLINNNFVNFHWMIFVLVILLISHGCDKNWKLEKTPPFLMGGIAEDSSPKKATVEFLKPQQTVRTVFRRGQRLDCEVRLTLTENARLPTFLTAIFRDPKGRDAGSFALIPKERSGNHFHFEQKLKAPRQAGAYKLIIDATYVSVSKNNPGIQSEAHDVIVLTNAVVTK